VVCVPADATGSLNVGSSLGIHSLSHLSSCQATCAQLSAAQAVECFDATSGVAKTSTGESLAELDVHVVQAEHLPWRDPRTHDMVCADSCLCPLAPPSVAHLVDRVLAR
jgi:hypothetical protein